ncbi:MAG: CBS protein [uncultured bacterium]|nr:MAG: CBS protein [uncultured bacterium]
MDIVPQLLLVILLVLLNGFFVASEFALVAVRKTRIDELVKQGNKSAKLVQKAVDHLDTYISATQLGITLASLGLGWVGEPVIAHVLEPHFQNILPSNLAFASAHGISIAIAFSIITFLHIVLGELAPKSIALQKAELTSLFIIRPLGLFTTIFKPFIFVLNGAGILVLKFIGFKAPSGHSLVHSEEEIKIILAESAEEGAIEKEEAEMVLSALKLGDIIVKKIMVPKTRVIAFEKSTPIEKVIKITQKNPHSRFPVYNGSIDNIIGFVHIKDIYRELITETGRITSIKDLYKTFLDRNRNKRLSELKIIRPIPRVSENRGVDDVMKFMREKRTHIAVARDESGHISGIVTLEDIVERLVGDIHDEFEEVKKIEDSKIKIIKSLIKK